MANDTLLELATRSKAAAAVIAQSSSETRNAALNSAADALLSASDEILQANADDIARAEASSSSSTVIDRLRLNEARIESMAKGLRDVAFLNDPVGEVVDGSVRPNGLRVRRVRVPLGVIGIVYENRPNVTSDAAALCLKSANSALLRGSTGAMASNKAITKALRAGIAKSGLPEDGVILVEDASRDSVESFIRMRGLIDCLIPRGGPALIGLVIDRATVPYVIDGDGNCHVYVDIEANLDMAERIVINAKTQRPSVCNAMESLVVHKAVAPVFLPRLQRHLEGVELVGDERARSILPDIAGATDEDFATEFLSLKMSIAVVDDIDQAIKHITKYSTGHSEAIVTNDLRAANRFVREIDAAAVLVNASTRFVDGGELGLGAEIGISTQKLHARGPMGLRELTSLKYIIEGNGQVRT